MSLINEVKKKKQFAELPDSVVKQALEISKEDLKGARAILRKYFGVFLSNKILSGKLSAEEILEKHISSKDRDYRVLYGRVFESFGSVGCVIDLGCGVNGFSYSYFPKNVSYIGVEGVGQLVNLMNNYFKKNKFNAKAIHADLFDLDFILKILESQKKKRIVFMFNIIDALEFFENDFSEEFILEISKECEAIVLSFPTKSLSGKTKFKVERKWILDFIKENFQVLDEFELNGERFIILKK